MFSVALPGWFTYTQMVKGRQSRLGHRKPSRGSSWPVMLTLLATCSFLILILLALPILSNSNANSSGRLIIKPNDLNSIALNTTTHMYVYIMHPIYGSIHSTPFPSHVSLIFFLSSVQKRSWIRPVGRAVGWNNIMGA